jgi:hypothetical protein
MVNEEAAANGRPGMDFNPRNPPTDMGYEPGEGIPLMTVKKMGDPVYPDGMEAGVAKEYLEEVLGSRIPFGNGLEIFF